jgi:hypothetical protein
MKLISPTRDSQNPASLAVAGIVDPHADQHGDGVNAARSRGLSRPSDSGAYS